MKYNAQFFINKFSKIPANKWTTGDFKNRKGQKCALGHCGVSDNKSTQMGKALSYVFKRYLGKTVLEINDAWIGYDLPGEGLSVSGKTPKTRILKALKLIKKREAAQNDN